MLRAPALRGFVVGMAIVAGFLAGPGCSKGTPIELPDGVAPDGAGIADAPVGVADAPVAVADGPVGVPDASPPPPPDATTCPTVPCDLHVQCGCQPMQACDLDFTDLVGTACRAAGAGDENDTCTTPASCAAGYVCVGTGAGDACEKYCDADADCVAPRGKCVIQLASGTMDIPGAVVCSSSCDPTSVVTGGVCPAAWKCTIQTVTFQGAPHDVVDCTVAGTGAIGTACTMDSQCLAGTVCLDTTNDMVANATCTRICTPPGAGSCQVGTTCVGFTPAFTVGGTTYGVCL